MTIYRRGPLYHVVYGLDRAFAYDARTGEATGDHRPRDYVGDDGRAWLPVSDREPIPQGLYDLLILKMPDRKE